MLSLLPGICHSTGSRTLAFPLPPPAPAQAELSAPSRGARIVLVLFHVRTDFRPCRGALLDASMLDRILLPFPLPLLFSDLMAA
jgi:hypothetical protein